MIHFSQAVCQSVLRPKEAVYILLQPESEGGKKTQLQGLFLQINLVVHMCLVCTEERLHAPELLAYAELHRWACWGMGAVSTRIKLWVGDPIAIQHTGTQGMSDILHGDILSILCFGSDAQSCSASAKCVKLSVFFVTQLEGAYN